MNKSPSHGSKEKYFGNIRTCPAPWGALDKGNELGESLETGSQDVYLYTKREREGGNRIKPVFMQVSAAKAALRLYAPCLGSPGRAAFISRFESHSALRRAASA